MYRSGGRRRRAASAPSGPQASESITRIGEGTVIEGEVTGGEDLVIEGKVAGTIELPNHVLTVGPTGRVKSSSGPPAFVSLRAMSRTLLRSPPRSLATTR